MIELSEHLRTLAQSMNVETGKLRPGDHSEIAADAYRATEECGEAGAELTAAVPADPNEFVVWLKRKQSDRRTSRISLNAAPIDVGVCRRSGCNQRAAWSFLLATPQFC